MKNPKSVLHGYLTDMAAVEQHIHEALERQIKTDALQRHPEAARAVEELKTVLERHLATLRPEIEGGDDGIDVVETVKKAVSGALGFFAGLYDRVRTDKASRMVRDNYTATSLAAVSYQMLHTTALGLKNERIAEMALNHLKDLTPLLVQLSEIVCNVVAHELAAEEKIFDGTVGEQAILNTHEAWSSNWIREMA